jgi:uncharacterized protein (DUF1800 family)
MDDFMVGADAPVEQPERAPALPPPFGAAGAALALSACGGGGGGGAPAPAPPPIVVVPTPVTATEASRFLGQSSMGASRAAIDQVVARGFEGWLTEQFALPRATTHWDWLIANGYNNAANRDNQTGFDPVMWRSMIAEPDQLRQRVGMALLDFLVVGIDGINLNWRQFAMAAYVDLLLDHAFGNYRQLLSAITTNAAMGSYLTFLGNRKANPNTGSVPDENYARELMQLFTIGLYRLNMDGTVQGGGQPVETYTQEDVRQLARVFTGFTLATSDSTTPDRHRLPMVINAGLNETGSAAFLGGSVAGGGMAAVEAALDIIFAHPNVPPFVSKQLIQRLVTSNPSGAYVQRVANVFANNGAGVRGDMKAVVRAILIDPDARGAATLSDPNFGRLRAPVLRLTGWARAFGATSPANTWPIGNTSDPGTRLGQAMGRSPSVFNFFRPGYTPPNTGIANAGLVAPEFQLANEVSAVGYVNYMASLIANGAGDFRTDYAAMLDRAADAQALVDEVNLVLAAGQLGPATVAAIRAAVESVPTSANNAARNRVQIAILLTLASPEYLVAR